MSDTLSAVVSGARPRRDQPVLYVGLNADAPRSPAARISLTGLDCVEIRRGAKRDVVFARRECREFVELTLADERLSQLHSRLVYDHGSWRFEDLGSKNGSWLRGGRVHSHVFTDGDVIIVGHTALVYRATGGEAKTCAVLAPSEPLGLWTTSPGLEARFADILVAARSTVAIEISGETGTGKELVARAVHKLSGRHGQFVAINCGAIANTLLEGELFGHCKGAYTGAVADRAGMIRNADHGTLFLDEIAELPPISQTALLRVLQEGEVTPLGSDRAVRVDLRVVTATHQDLDEAVAAGRFRADLRARLLGFRLELPPLRERAEDLGFLVASLLEPRCSARFTVDTVAALYAYTWPLNVRELQRALASASVLARDRIELSHLPAPVRGAVGTQAAAVTVDVASLCPADRALRERLEDAITRHGGNLAEVARELGKDRTQIRRWMQRFGLRRNAL